MTECPNAPSPNGPPLRRASDAAPPAGDSADAENVEALYRLWRSGALDTAQVAAVAPVDALFAWHAQRRIDEAEFAALIAAQEVHEVLITDVAAERNVEVDAEQARQAILASALRARVAALDLVVARDTAGEDELRPVLKATQLLAEGVGIHLVFVSPATPPGGANPLPPPGTSLTVLFRAYSASASLRSAVKCEAVFSCPAMSGELYCRVVLPLPIVKGGRRRLFVSVLDNDSRHPIKLPPTVAELFQEKYLQRLEVLSRPANDAGGLGGLLKGTIGRILGR